MRLRTALRLHRRPSSLEICRALAPSDQRVTRYSTRFGVHGDLAKVRRRAMTDGFIRISSFLSPARLFLAGGLARLLNVDIYSYDKNSMSITHVKKNLER